MGKGATKKKQKWKSLELDPPVEEEQKTPSTTNPQHPFLKIISRNMEAIISTDTGATKEGGRGQEGGVPMYRSSRHLGVAATAPQCQYAGAPIQYCSTRWVEPWCAA